MANCFILLILYLMGKYSYHPIKNYNTYTIELRPLIECSF
jgi:hypothetical protein